MAELRRSNPTPERRASRISGRAPWFSIDGTRSGDDVAVRENDAVGGDERDPRRRLAGDGADLLVWPGAGRKSVANSVER